MLFTDAVKHILAQSGKQKLAPEAIRFPCFHFVFVVLVYLKTHKNHMMSFWIKLVVVPCWLFASIVWVFTSGFCGPGITDIPRKYSCISFYMSGRWGIWRLIAFYVVALSLAFQVNLNVMDDAKQWLTWYVQLFPFLK